MFSQINSVVYFVDDINKVADWYSAVLSQKPDYKSPTLVIFKQANSKFILHPIDGKSKNKGGSQVAYWEVENISDAKIKLVNSGAVIYREIIESESGGELVCQLLDPFGNIIGLSQLS